MDNHLIVLCSHLRSQLEWLSKSERPYTAVFCETAADELERMAKVIEKFQLEK